MGANRHHISRRNKGRRINYLKTVIDIQDIVKKYGKQGLGYSQKWIYDNIVDIQGSGYHISYATFNNYLSVPSPQTELNKLLNNETN
jgi:hypothetical protein